jgi:hypothetical protein
MVRAWANRGVVLLLVLALGGFLPSRGTLGQTETGSPGPNMDQAIALLNDARQHFENVRDYECRLVKSERINGTLLPECVLTMKVRNRPQSVYLHCESPEAEKGLEVCYVEGANNGMMRVHPPGIKGILGFWSVATNDPRALKKSRHCVTEAGLGNLIDGTARYWEM